MGPYQRNGSSGALASAPKQAPGFESARRLMAVSFRRHVVFMMLAILGAAVPSRAEPGMWLATEYIYRINQDFSIIGDNQWRSWDLEKTDFNTLLIRNSLVYRDRIGAGYAFLNRGDFGESDRVRTEHRTFQDFYTGRHRFRSEQRWVEGRFSTRYRWKYYLEHKQWYGYNELFLTPDGFNQNRTKIGYRVTDHLAIAAQYIESTRDSWQMVFTYNF